MVVLSIKTVTLIKKLMYKLILPILVAGFVIIGCKPAATVQPEPEYRMVRPETSKMENGVKITSLALFEKTGDSNHIYMQELDGTNLIKLPK